MNHAFRISIAANIFLAALVLWLIRRTPVAAERLPAAGAVELSTRAAETAAVRPAVADSNPEPFRWSELESTDYRTYLANLRRVGCPAQTIRDILIADVHSAYARRRERLERALRGGDAAPAEAELAELRREEASLLATLLGDAPPAPQPDAKTPPWILAKRNARPVMPLVLGSIDPAALLLNEGQIAIISQVRQQFQQEIGVQDPNDPAYRQRWNAAQRNADDRLRGMLGSKVYIQCQLQAANQTSQAAKSE